MKVGIDSYCYHRYFGEIYPDQRTRASAGRFTISSNRAAELEVDGVSLGVLFLREPGAGYLTEIKAVLDELGMERVLAWGHPDGLEAGRNEEAWREMNALIPKAQFMGADIMRIVASSLMFRNEPHGPQIERSSGC
jgi:3-oxoisoapionate decarboxylase